MAPLCYRLVFTSLLRQPHKRENILCCATIVALAANVWRQEKCGNGRAEEAQSRGTCLWLVSSKSQLKHFNQPLGSVQAGVEPSLSGVQDFAEEKG